MASLSGDVVSIAAQKVIAAATAAGLVCSITPSAAPLSVTISGVCFDSNTANTAAVLAVAAGAASQSPGAYPAVSRMSRELLGCSDNHDLCVEQALADVNLEELLFWDARTVSPLIVELVAFGKLQGAGAAASWAALKKLHAEPQVRRRL